MTRTGSTSAEAALSAREIEIACAAHFNSRINVIVPNVSWGLGLRYEADLLVLRPSGYCDEVEIKCTRSDIIRDLSKQHNHDYRYVRLVWFAVPAHLATCDKIPDYAGILSLSRAYGRVHVTTIRSAKLRRKNPERMPDKIVMKLLRLASMRVWTLKERMENLCSEFRNYKKISNA